MTDNVIQFPPRLRVVEPPADCEPSENKITRGLCEAIRFAQGDTSAGKATTFIVSDGRAVPAPTMFPCGSFVKVNGRRGWVRRQMETARGLVLEAFHPAARWSLVAKAATGTD